MLELLPTLTGIGSGLSEPLDPWASGSRRSGPDGHGHRQCQKAR